MFKNSDYHDLVKLYEDEDVCLYQCVCDKNNQNKLIQFLRTDVSDLVRQRFIKKVRSVQEIFTSKAISLVKDEDEVYVVSDFDDGSLLGSVISNSVLGLEERIAICVDVVSIASNMYRQGLIFNDYKLNHYMYCADTKNLDLVYFGGFSLRGENSPKIYFEETGDQYPLMPKLASFLCEIIGVDENELGSYEDNNYDVPEPVFNILLRMLGKVENKSYLSLWGVGSDLSLCLSQLRSFGFVEDFSLAKNDSPDKLLIGEALYDRESEIGQLYQQYREVSLGGKRYCLVSGKSGVGKTALAKSIKASIDTKGGFFIEGKYEQFQKNTPYAVLSSAFSQFVNKMAAKSRGESFLWGQRVKDALGPNGNALLKILPELEEIIGPQPDLLDLPLHESQNRFEFVFQSFLRVCCTEENPVVLFLDDTQWIDEATYRLLVQIKNNNELKYFYLIASFRDSHLETAIAQKKRMLDSLFVGGDCLLLNLQPLSASKIAQYLSDIMRCDIEYVRGIAKLLEIKTEGNPLYLTSLLRTLIAEQLVYFNYENHQWQWSLSKIEEYKTERDVTDFIQNKLRRLDEHSQLILHMAACLGASFSIEKLACVCEVDKDLARRLLEKAIGGKLVLPVIVDRDRKSAEVQPEIYCFNHDRTQQAAYHLKGEKSRLRNHWRIGHILRRVADDKLYSDNLFEVVDHLNIGRSLVTEQARIDELAELNRSAARIAAEKSSYEASYQYLRIAIELLPINSWDTDFALTMGLYQSVAEKSCICGDFSETKKYCQLVISNAQENLQKVPAYETLIQTAILENRQNDAVALGYEILALLGVKLPKASNDIQIAKALFELKLTLLRKGLSPEKLLTQREMTNPIKQAVMRVLLNVGLAAYRVDPKLFPIVLLKLMHESVKHGNAPESSLAYAAYGLLLSGVLGDVEQGYHYGQAALKLAKQPQARVVRAKTISITHYFVNHWKVHAKDALQPLLDAHKIALETGDVVYAALILLEYSATLFFCGRDISTLERALVKSVDSAELKEDPTLPSLLLLQQLVSHLKTPVENPSCFKGSYYDEDNMLPKHIADNDENIIAVFYLYKMMVGYWFGNYQEASSAADKIIPYLGGLTGMVHVPVYHFYAALIELINCSSLRGFERQRALWKVRKHEQKIKKWAKRAPMNYQNKAYLIAAERCALTGNDAQAARYYDEAIRLSKLHGYQQEHALSSERAGLYYLAKQNESYARACMAEAHHLYLRWGADAKAYALLLQHRELLESGPSSLQHQLYTDAIKKADKRQIIDLNYHQLLESSQQLSASLLVESAVDSILALSLEYSCAEAAAYIELSDESVKFISCKSKNGDSGHLTQDYFDKASSLPVSVVYQVQNNPESIVIDDLAAGLPFMDLEEVGGIKGTIACLPVLKNGAAVGALYLENQNEVGAFCESQLASIELLLKQASISFDNAKQFETLIADQEKVKQFVAAVSHEVRNPLNAIIGLSDIMLETHQLNDELAEHGKLISTAANDLLAIVNDLLDYSKVSSGQFSLELQEFSMRTLTDYLQRLTEVKAKEKGIDLSFDVATSVPDVMLGDVTRLGQVLKNLLANAIKFTDNGQVKLEVGYKGYQHGWNELEFIISDSGIGIAPEFIEAIFEPYAQGGDDIFRNYGGTGLGLSICKGLVQMMGGDIWVESQEGRGSRFIFTTRFKTSDSGQVVDIEPDSLEKYSVKSLSGINVLLVEDNEINQMVACEMLEEAGAAVSKVSDGNEAITALENSNYDIVLMDFNMPVLNGVDATQLIRSGKPFNRFENYETVPILGLSANVSEDIITQGMSCGMNGYIRKPINKQTLLATIGQFVREKLNAIGGSGHIRG